MVFLAFFDTMWHFKRPWQPIYNVFFSKQINYNAEKSDNYDFSDKKAVQ